MLLASAAILSPTISPRCPHRVLGWSGVLELQLTTELGVPAQGDRRGTGRVSSVATVPVLFSSVGDLDPKTVSVCLHLLALLKI